MTSYQSVEEYLVRGEEVVISPDWIQELCRRFTSFRLQKRSADVLNENLKHTVFEIIFNMFNTSYPLEPLFHFFGH